MLIFFLKNNINKNTTHVEENDINIQVFFNLLAVREDLRIIDEANFTDIPRDENASELLAKICCYDNDVNLYDNINGFSELFWGLSHQFKNALNDIKENLKHQIEDFNKQNNTSYKDTWGKYKMSGSKLFVSPISPTPEGLKLINILSDPNIINV